MVDLKNACTNRIDDVIGNDVMLGLIDDVIDDDVMLGSTQILFVLHVNCKLDSVWYVKDYRKCFLEQS